MKLDAAVPRMSLAQVTMGIPLRGCWTGSTVTF